MPKGAKPEARAVAEARRERVARLYVRGVTQAEIARKEGVSEKTVSLDLKSVRAAWARNAQRDVSERIHEEIARIDAIEVEAWESWNRSKEDAETRSQEVEEALRSVKDAEGEKTGEAALVPVSRKLKVTSKGQTGDAKFLDKIAWCVETRLRLLDAFPRESKRTTVEVGDGKVTVFIEDLHTPGPRPSASIEARLREEEERLRGLTVEQAPPPPLPPPDANGRNGSH